MIVKNKKTDFLEEATKTLDSLNKEASVARGVWITFNVVLAILAVSAMAVTHEDLFFGNPKSIPILNVEVPVTWFFFLSPPFIILLHFAMLLEHSLLARKAVAFNDILTQSNSSDAQKSIRHRASTYFFVQNIVAPDQSRIILWGTRLISWITLDLVPILVILLFQFQFLPYQHTTISWAHRIFVTVAVINVFVMGLSRRLPTLSIAQAFTSLARSNKVAFSAFILLLTLPTGLTWLVALGAHERGAIYDYSRFGEKLGLFEVAIDDVQSSPASIFSQRLYLPKIDFTTERFRGKSPNLRGRNFVAANFSGAKMPKTDFSAADLSRADLSNGDFTGSSFACANRANLTAKEKSLLRIQKEESISCVNLYGADLRGANLRDADFEGAWMVLVNARGTDFRDANLEKANGFLADFRGANFSTLNHHRFFAQFADFRSASIRSIVDEPFFYQTFEFDDESQYLVFYGADFRFSRLRIDSVQGSSFGSDDWQERLPKYEPAFPDIRGSQLSLAILDEQVSPASESGSTKNDQAVTAEPLLSGISGGQSITNYFERDADSHVKLWEEYKLGFSVYLLSTWQTKHLREFYVKDARAIALYYVVEGDSELIESIAKRYFERESFVDGVKTADSRVSKIWEVFTDELNGKSPGFGTSFGSGYYGGGGDSGCGCGTAPLFPTGYDLDTGPNFSTALFAKRVLASNVASELSELSRLILEVWARPQRMIGH
jgi:uncharacterized protein YjbI with pentapeptide repeats